MNRQKNNQKRALKNGLNDFERFIQKVQNWPVLVLVTSIIVLSSLFADPNVNIRRPFLLTDVVRKGLIVLLNNLGGISLTTALFLYIKEAPNRKQKSYFEALLSFDSDAHVRQALEYLNEENISLAKISIAEKNLREVQLEGAQLSSARLVHNVFQKANLSEADLEEARLDYSDLSEAILTRSNLIGSHLGNARLLGKKLIEAQLQGAEMQGVLLQKADLSNANLKEAKLYDAKLQGATLIGADFQGAHLSGAKLDETDISGANFDGAELAEVSLRNVKGWTDEQLGSAHLIRTKLPDGSKLDPNRDVR
ncbi:MAG: pentapeptide repeat-containing protein [Cyanobacteria bacterium P01_D01_bin.115]